MYIPNEKIRQALDALYTAIDQLPRHATGWKTLNDIIEYINKHKALQPKGDRTK